MSQLYPKTTEREAINAQAEIHHALLLGMQLTVSMECGGEVMEQWMFKLFRRQHEDKFLSSFKKLGLDGLPDAVACAQYHVLSNGIGGVPVQYVEESDKKAWVRFRYPRWMYAGPTVCGVPIGVSRGFLKGWYAQNGVSLNNPRLGFVCVSEDMSGEFGFCGYFKEYDRDLSPDERLQFAQGELPPQVDLNNQPAPPPGQWSEGRLAKANRNYALEYIRNGLSALSEVIGVQTATEIASRSARLIGLQYYQSLAQRIGAKDGSPEDAAKFLATLFVGMGDEAAVLSADAKHAVVVQRGMRIARGLEKTHGAQVMAVWGELWRGAVRSHSLLMDLDNSANPDGSHEWRINALQ